MRLAKVDTDAEPSLAQRFAIQGIPTMVLFKDGQAVDAIVGYLPKQKLLDRLQPHLVVQAGSI